MTLDPNLFYEAINTNGINFFTGVPDSLLKEFCLCIDDNVSEKNHIITANEGNSIALAAGYNIATNSVPLVYMQNSGLGNAVNPLLSLCDPAVYSIPMIVMIGWRGEPGVKDEPQHVTQGKIQLNLLKSLGLKSFLISGKTNNYREIISDATQQAISNKSPVVLLIKKGTFESYKSKYNKKNPVSLEREIALESILKNVENNSIVVATTGKTSREIFEIRENKSQLHNQDFLTVGSMGHSSSIALGIAIAKPDIQVTCIDGDGSLIMHMGSLSTIGKISPKNYFHIVINNNVHESVGGQKTSAENIDFQMLAKSNGYKYSNSIIFSDSISNKIKNFYLKKGPALLEVKLKAGSRENLGRPTISPLDSKIDLMKFINEK
tara:strand:+ start:1434 stop:2567 length:1134 start_codon:yes stop_codon:yes gene_type:complete